MYRTVALVVLSLTVVSVSAYGADETTPSAVTPTTPLEETTPSVGNVDWSLPPVEISAGPRPSVLPILYVSFAALQGDDARRRREFGCGLGGEGGIDGRVDLVCGASVENQPGWSRCDDGRRQRHDGVSGGAERFGSQGFALNL
jgi:hypothetical protein